MIRTNLTKVILLGVWGLVMSAAFISCADDHFDIPEGDGADGIATESLWSLLSSNPELSNFASIVEKTPAFKDEKHKIEGYTFKDILNGNQVLTLFAPDNTAFTKADVEEYEELLLVSPYDAFLRLIGNHLARNRYVASGMNPQGKPERLIFLNNKKGTFNREAKTIKDIPLTKSNLSATNGVMHIVSAQIPFAYNIYEYIRANKGYTHLNDWINRHDTLYFNSNLSAVAGTDPETGEPIYVDSVYTRFNSLYYYSYQPNSIEWAMPHKGLNANIEQEDSTWAMVLPTDAAWEEAAEQMRPWYNYADNYFDMSKVDDMPINNEQAKALMLLEVTNDLQEDAIAMDIVSPLAFNIRMQRRTPEQPDFWTVESFLKYKISKLFNTRTDTFLIDKEGTEDVRKLLFEDKAPVYVSNGLVYPVDHWNYRKTYNALNVEVKAKRDAIFQNVRYNLTDAEISDTKQYAYMCHYDNVGINNGGELAKKYGSVSQSGTFMSFYTNVTSLSPQVNFKLRGNEEDAQVLSNLPYQVGIVLVPDFYRNNIDPELNPDAIKKNRLTVTITYLEEDKKEKTTANLKWTDPETQKTTAYVDYQGAKVDTLWLDDIITFPNSYRNLPKAYPTIKIASQRITQSLTKQGYQPRFNLDRIILRPKSNEE